MKVRGRRHARAGALVTEELDLDEPGEGEAVVRMSAVGVCGTDLHSYKGEWDRPTPIVLGHEGAGVVEAVGADVAGLREGDRVVLSWAPACGECGPCRRGRPAACGPLGSAIGTGHPPRRPHGPLARRRDRLPRHGDGRARRAARRRRRDRAPARRRRPARSRRRFSAARRSPASARSSTPPGPSPGSPSSSSARAASASSSSRVPGSRAHAEILVVDPVEARREQALALGATRACAPDDLREAVRELDAEGVDLAVDAVGHAATTKPRSAGRAAAAPASSSACPRAARSSSSTRSSSRTARRP